MFNLSYDSWSIVCERYLYKLKEGQMKCYIQFYPFLKLSHEDKEYIKSREFFEKYIKNFSCVLYDATLEKSDNFLQKKDGSFRNSTLISPILFLIIEAIGQEIFQHYLDNRKQNIEVFYAGDLKLNDATYKRSYDNFTKLINMEINNYNYYIKTDIQNFFDNININYLMNMIDKNCNHFSNVNLKIFKELLLYCGNDKFPIVENSSALSYIATVIYLNDVDNKLYDFIQNNIQNIESFKIIRYVDDMYILFESSSSYNELQASYNYILDEYSSILHDVKLTLNMHKVKFDKIEYINEVLSNSIYREVIQGDTFEITDLFIENFNIFLETIIEKCKSCGNIITRQQYMKIVEDIFNLENSELTPNEILNVIVFDKKDIFKKDKTLYNLRLIIDNHFDVLYLDPKKFLTMILNTRNEGIIKFLLSKILNNNKIDVWNIHNSIITIFYLMQRNFQHTALIKVLKNRLPNFYRYCEYFCKQSFIQLFDDDNMECKINIINDSNDWKLYFLYAMYRFEEDRNDILSELAFFKNYCDRLIAHLDKYINNRKKPNYKIFYKKKEWEKFFKSISDDEIDAIDNIYKKRNGNPLCHSSAELLDKASSDDIQDCIMKVSDLIERYVNKSINKKNNI